MDPATIFLLGGLATTGFGASFVYRSRLRARWWRDFTRRSQITRGQVIDLRSRRVHRADGPDYLIYKPVVRFGLPDGRGVEAVTLAGSNPPPARVGDVVDVRYDPGAPTNVNLLNGPTGGQISCVLTGLGIAMILMGAIFVGIWYVVTQVFP